MRQPSILDVVKAVTEVAPAYPQVATWWYSPGSAFRLRGELDGAGEKRVPLEIAVEPVEQESPDLDRIASALAQHLWDNPVAVRTHRGPQEADRLYKVLTARRQ